MFSMSSHEMTRFARDRDRISSSRPFRRLAAKTQVVALPADPLVRTRLTHTMEVSSIAREIGAALGLCDPLLDAIALGHDLGHPAFGHAGERALAALVPGGFHHAAHSVRVVTVLEPGLDLAPEVVDGIFQPSKGARRRSLRPRRGARISDGRGARRSCGRPLRLCLPRSRRRLPTRYPPAQRFPPSAVKVLGAEPESVRHSLVTSTVRASLERGDICLDPEAETALQTLRSFLYDRLYEGARISAQTAFVRSLFESLWGAALERPRAIRRHARGLRVRPWAI